MPKRTKSRVVVAVDWLDAKGDTAWQSEAEARNEEPALCTTVGVIVSRTKRRIVIAGTVGHGGDEQIGDVNVIPNGMIRCIATLGEILIEEATPPKKART